MKKTVIMLPILLSALTCHCEPEIGSIPAGSVLVYQHQLESQYCPDEVYDKYYKAYNKDCDMECDVGSKAWESTEKVLAVDSGLRYGFPLKVGMEWAQECDFKRTDHMYCRYVEKIEDITVPAGTFKNCFKVVYRTCPDEEAEWYCPGVGVVKYEYKHHGTIINEACELKEIIK
jgi:hypothetical protein